MLVEFRVENDRSIRSTATLSTIADRLPKDDKDVGQPISTPFDFSIVPVIGIFGPNASGKTTLLRALNDCLRLLCGRPWQSQTWRPFLLNDSTSSKPTKFHLKAWAGDAVFEYDLEINSSQVFNEKLYYRPKETRHLRRLFERTWDPAESKHIWSNGKDFDGAHVQIEEGLAINKVYLGFISESLKVPVVEPFLEWAENCVPYVFTSDDRHLEPVIAELMKRNEELKPDVLKHMQRFGTGIADFEVRTTETSSGNKYQIFVTPDCKGANAKWPLDDESHGNRRLFQLSFFLTVALRLGGILIVDEINSGFHQAISETLIRIFHDKKINTANGQLVFASHDSRHLSRELMRRDEIWFTKRGDDFATTLFPLTDFDIRGDLSIPRAYLDGRFDSYPNISNIDAWEDHSDVKSPSK